MQDHKNNHDCQFIWYYLALTFSIIGENKTSTSCLKESKKILSGKVAKITDKNHRKGFIKKNIINQQIMNKNEKTLIDLTDSLKVQISSVGMSNFCSECGYSNIDLKSFCPECGYDLRIN